MEGIPTVRSTAVAAAILRSQPTISNPETFLDPLFFTRILNATITTPPALLARPDGRVLALYSKHGPENKIYYRVSAISGGGQRWEQERTFVPSRTSRITYSNLHFLSDENQGKGRVFQFLSRTRSIVETIADGFG